MESRITLHFETMPEKIKAFTVQKSAEEYAIVLNKDLCPLLQWKSTGHELCHIFSGHFQRTDLANLEEEAEREAWHFYREYKDKIAQ